MAITGGPWRVMKRADYPTGFRIYGHDGKASAVADVFFEDDANRIVELFNQDRQDRGLDRPSVLVAQEFGITGCGPVAFVVDCIADYHYAGYGSGETKDACCEPK
jgi:hypothetical protein